MPVIARAIVANSLIGNWKTLQCLCTPHGKPESFVKRRMGVALAFDADVEIARTRAKLAASKVKPRRA